MMELPFINYKVNSYGKEKERQEDLLFVCKELIPCWKKIDPQNIEFKIVNGGITNQLFRAISSDFSCLVRIYGPSTDLVVNREKEKIIATYLGTLEPPQGPRVYGMFSNGRLERWLDYKTLCPTTMANDHFSSKIAYQLALFHSLKPPALSNECENNPILWDTIFRFLKVTDGISFHDNPAKQKLLDDIDLVKLKVELMKLQKTCNKLPTAVVKLSHQDLLSGNIMYDENTDSIMFIDFEYGGCNYFQFDIANHFCEYAGFDCNWNLIPNRDKQISFISKYLEKCCVDYVRTNMNVQDIWYSVQPFILASHAYWGVWGIVQARYSLVDFDYLSYAHKRILAMREFQLNSPYKDIISQLSS